MKEWYEIIYFLKNDLINKCIYFGQPNILFVSKKYLITQRFGEATFASRFAKSVGRGFDLRSEQLFVWTTDY